MKMSTRVGLAIVLSIAAALGSAESAYRMKVLIKPGAMSEAVGKGEVAIVIRISGIDVSAGAPLLSLNTMVPGLSKPQRVEGLTVKDDVGAVPDHAALLGGYAHPGASLRSGAMYFAVLNGKIGRRSKGRRSLDDLIQAIVDRARSGAPVTEAIWLDMLRKELGEDGLAVHRAMLAGDLMLPESGDYGPCFRWLTRMRSARCHSRGGTW